MKDKDDKLYSKKEIQKIKKDGLILCIPFGFGLGVIATILILWSNHTIL